MAHEIRHIAQILLFTDGTHSRELGPVLWAALQESSTFFATVPEAPSFSQHFVAKELPPGFGAADLGRERVKGFLSPEHRRRSRGRYKGTVEVDRLTSAVDELLEPPPEIMMIVVDEELTPPEGYRYIIWDDAKDRSATVVSLAPLDPLYWGLGSTDRLPVIKQRARSAVLCALGEWLWLDRCNNPSCFMFEAVDSVDSLDRMTLLGKEHGIPRLSNMGFDPYPPDPKVVQPIIHRRLPPEAAV
jgi:predicted Zn-dependent protease